MSRPKSVRPAAARTASEPQSSDLPRIGPQTTPNNSRQKVRARYVAVFQFPKSVGKGRVLAHNHVAHTVDMPCGLNGFRCWTWPEGEKPRHFKRCKCGWSGLPHYRLRGESKRQDAQMDRCVTGKQMHAYLFGTR